MRLPDSRVLFVAIVAAACLTGSAGTAWADADPASDFLASGTIFTPYAPNRVSPPLVTQLRLLTAQARRLREPVRVAIVAAKFDLGGIPASYLEHPNTYAHFLAEEIRYVYKGQVLIVEPAGLGLFGPNKALGDRVLADLIVPPKPTSDELATVAVTAVRRLAAAQGHPLSAVPLAVPAAGSAWPLRLAVAGGALIALALAGLAVVVRRRQRLS